MTTVRNFTTTNCTYEGTVCQDRIEGNGTFVFPNGNKYVGEFKDGMFHGNGIIYFPSGARIEGTWENGVKKTGQYIYSDELHYKKENWEYCTPGKDRRIWNEVVNEKKEGIELEDEKENVKSLEGLRPALPKEFQIQHLQNEKVAHIVPEGMYDAFGEGYYNPTNCKIYDYETNQEIRIATEDEKSRIISECRVRM